MSDQAAGGGVKSCGLCGIDVTSKPRVKDGKGNYFCRECAAKKQADLAQKVNKTVGASAPAGVAADDPDIMAKLVEDSVSKGVNACPACRKPWKEGAQICVACGFNKETGRMVGTQIQRPDVVKGPKVASSKGGRRGGGGKKFAGAHWKIAVVLTLLFGAGCVASIMSPEFGAIFSLAVVLYSLIIGIFATIDAYTESESIVKALLVFVCGIYALYYCCVETSNDLLKGSAWAWIFILLFFVLTIVIGGASLAALQGMQVGG